MSRRSSRHSILADRVSQNNKKVKNSCGKEAFFSESRKRAETQRLIDKYGARV